MNHTLEDSVTNALPCYACKPVRKIYVFLLGNERINGETLQSDNMKYKYRIASARLYNGVMMLDFI